MFNKKECDKRMKKLEEKVRMLEDPKYAENKKILGYIEWLGDWMRCDSLRVMYSTIDQRDRMARAIYEYFKIDYPEDEKEKEDK